MHRSSRPLTARDIIQLGQKIRLSFHICLMCGTQKYVPGHSVHSIFEAGYDCLIVGPDGETEL